MMNLSPELTVVAFMAFTALLLNLRQMLVNRSLHQQLVALGAQQRVAEPQQDDKVTFSENLSRVEQQINSVPHAPSTPQADRYNYVASLAQQGYDADGIAAALQMSVAEVQQLTQLARLKNAPVKQPTQGR